MLHAGLYCPFCHDKWVGSSFPIRLLESLAPSSIYLRRTGKYNFVDMIAMFKLFIIPKGSVSNMISRVVRLSKLDSKVLDSFLISNLSLSPIYLGRTGKYDFVDMIATFNLFIILKGRVSNIILE